jgi:hypothetical protein
MSRDLVWLQKYSFAAWGCTACSWVMPSLDRRLSGQASAPIRAAFDKHDCKKFPTYISPKEKRPSRSAGL